MGWTEDENHIPLALELSNRKKGQAVEKRNLATKGWEAPQDEHLQVQKGEKNL